MNSNDYHIKIRLLEMCNDMRTINDQHVSIIFIRDKLTFKTSNIRVSHICIMFQIDLPVLLQCFKFHI